MGFWQILNASLVMPITHKASSNSTLWIAQYWGLDPVLLNGSKCHHHTHLFTQTFLSLKQYIKERLWPINGQYCTCLVLDRDDDISRKCVLDLDWHRSPSCDHITKKFSIPYCRRSPNAPSRYWKWFAR